MPASPPKNAETSRTTYGTGKTGSLGRDGKRHDEYSGATILLLKVQRFFLAQPSAQLLELPRGNLNTLLGKPR